MNKGMSTVFKILLTFFIALIILIIFLYSQGYTKMGAEEYFNATKNTSIPDMSFEDILKLFEGEKEDLVFDFYCANSFPGMLKKDFCGCFDSDSKCQNDRIYSEDNNCEDAYGSYDIWSKGNTHVAICLEGDDCCNMAGEVTGQCLLVDLTKFNGNLITLDGFIFRVDVDSGKNCNNDLYVYGKYETGLWSIIADKLDGGDEHGLDGIYLDESFFSGKLSMIAICPNPDGQGDDWQCDHKIDWVKFRTKENPDVSICPSGKWSGEVLIGKWNGNAGVEDRNFTVNTNGFVCEPPGGDGKDTGGCTITKIYRKQIVEDWGGVLVGSGDSGQHNNGLFTYSSPKINEILEDDLEKACVGGSGNGDWRTYENEINLKDMGATSYYLNGEEIILKSEYWELTGSMSGCTTDESTGSCHNKPKQRKCCPSPIDTMCARRSYDMGNWELKLYGSYCCPEGMFWDGIEMRCIDGE